MTNWPNSQYWGCDDFYDCGAWTQDGEEVDGTEEHRAARAKVFPDRWKAALPEGTQPLIDRDAWLYGVRLPGGKEVLR